eukprot:maker-scaffold853_size88743-snap-gene-0.15 protein:Tk09860 transcript:maker-scaffold853_size88743-snap-gene-0.15-mRNA-1 annotation:"---NA---"
MISTRVRVIVTPKVARKSGLAPPGKFGTAPPISRIDELAEGHFGPNRYCCSTTRSKASLEPSLIIIEKRHRLIPNPDKRYSVVTREKKSFL